MNLFVIKAIDNYKEKVYKGIKPDWWRKIFIEEDGEIA